ncbi:MAG: hypothetical protein H6512_06745 [Acidimicrobiia bacterium]|nr:hypothetical protein [Acidimicrobiia bacterium]
MFTKEPARQGVHPRVSAALVAWPIPPAVLQSALPAGVYGARIGGPTWVVMGIVPRQVGFDHSVTAFWSPVIGPADLLGAFVHSVWTEGPLNAWGARRWAGSSGGWARSSLSSIAERPGAQITATCRSRGVLFQQTPIRLLLKTTAPDPAGPNKLAFPSPPMETSSPAETVPSRVLDSPSNSSPRPCLYRRDEAGLSCVRADVQIHQIIRATVGSRTTPPGRNPTPPLPWSWARIASPATVNANAAKDHPIAAVGRVSVELHPPFRMGTPVRARIPALFRMQRAPVPADPLSPASPHIQSFAEALTIADARSTQTAKG